MHTLPHGGGDHVDGMALVNAQRTLFHPAAGQQHRVLPPGPDPGGGTGLLNTHGPGGQRCPGQTH